MDVKCLLNRCPKLFQTNDLMRRHMFKEHRALFDIQLNDWKLPFEQWNQLLYQSEVEKKRRVAGIAKTVDFHIPPSNVERLERLRLKEYFAAMAQSFCEPDEYVVLNRIPFFNWRTQFGELGGGSSTTVQNNVWNLQPTIGAVSLNSSITERCNAATNNSSIDQGYNLFSDGVENVSHQNATIENDVFNNDHSNSSQNPRIGGSEELTTARCVEIDRCETPTQAVQLSRPVTPESSQSEMFTYMCDYCSMKCATRVQLIKHVHQSHPATPYSEDYTCKVCRRKMQNLNLLRTHQHECIEKSVTCCRCDAIFSDNQVLKIHCRDNHL